MQLSGLTLLFLGWGSVLTGHTSWIANPLFLYCVVCMTIRPRLALLAAAMALTAAHDFASVASLGFDSSGDIEAGEVTHLKVGAYLWFGSLALAFLASSLHVCLISKRPKEVPGGGEL